ncbi:hypothetical protein [Maritalea sp.]|uniref:hypothetical protein n=1 Tax=Maritalea sp. TaxID=2003361 RepID=UPI003EF4A010
MNSITLAYLLSSSAGFSVGTVFLKKFADTGAFTALGTAFGIFAVSNLIYAKLLQVGIGQGVVLSSMAQLILMSTVGIVLFGERMTPFNLTGLVLALIAVWAFALHSQALA